MQRELKNIGGCFDFWGGIRGIQNAINFSHREMSQNSTLELDKESLYICYCDGIGRKRSGVACGC